MVEYNKNIVIAGCGGVVQCTLPLLFKHIAISPKNVTIIDFVDNRARVQEFLDQGVVYIQEKITPENYTHILKKHLKSGDLFIDLAWNIDTIAMIQWCHEQNVLYINTSIEEWEPYKDIEKVSPNHLTLYHRHMRIKEAIKNWNKKSATAIVDHGANPGLVSHFTKQALTEIATKIVQEKPQDPRAPKLEEALATKDFAQLGYLTNTQVIHISERDTQITRQPKQVDEFVNTWSVEGFIEEGLAPSELGWGTHEKQLPAGAMTHKNGPHNQILLATRGIDTWVRSWVPSGPIVGMVIRHGEAFGISERLTVWQGDKPVYRPTVHYAYCPTDSALSSLHELRMRNFEQQDSKRILNNNDIISGKDEVGCLLMGHDFNGWWIGSLLDINDARKLVPHQNSTTVQVAISVIAAALYALKNPEQGFCLPDDIDHEEILKVARPYLGEFFSGPTDWTPLSGPNQFLVFGKNRPKKEDVWQFSTFLINNDYYTW
jgi:homospermidine synthase